MAWGTAHCFTKKRSVSALVAHSQRVSQMIPHRGDAKHIGAPMTTSSTIGNWTPHSLRVPTLPHSVNFLTARRSQDMAHVNPRSGVCIIRLKAISTCFTRHAPLPSNALHFHHMNHLEERRSGVSDTDASATSRSGTKPARKRCSKKPHISEYRRPTVAKSTKGPRTWIREK